MAGRSPNNDDDPGWTKRFVITKLDDNGNKVAQLDGIPLNQTGNSTFTLDPVSIEYRGRTGLEKFIGRSRHGITEEDHERARTVTHLDLPSTDLASVPGPLRWFSNAYGPHTPAALIHDWLIPGGDDPDSITNSRPKISEEHTDRYFRYMLGSVGVPLFKRQIMWSAVALRTRFSSPLWWKKWLVAIWAITSALGITAFVASIVSKIWLSGTVLGIDATALLIASLIAPFIASLFWGRQYTAGIVAALTAPWLLPAVVFVGVGWLGYRGLEETLGRIDRFIRA